MKEQTLRAHPEELVLTNVNECRILFVDTDKERRNGNSGKEMGQ